MFKTPANHFISKNLFWTILFVLTILQLTTLFFSALPLDPDEAQYWIWSRDLNWGYYTKPPMIALLIKLSTSLLGSDSEFAIRALSPIIMLATSVVVYLIGRDFYNLKTGQASALTFATCYTMVSFSLFAVTDVPIFLIVALCIYFYLKAIQKNDIRFWLATGVVIGVGLLTKYHIILLVLCIALHQTLIHGFIKPLKNKNIYFCFLAAFIIFLPNLIWNIQTNLATFRHLQGLAVTNNSEGLAGITGLLKFIITQFGIFSPIVFSIYLYILSQKSTFKNRTNLILIIFSLPFIVLILPISLTKTFHANWTIAAFIGIAILASDYMLKAGHNKLIKINLCLNAIAAVAVLIAILSIPHFNSKHNFTGHIYKKFGGWKEAGSELSSFLNTLPKNSIIASDSRRHYSEIVYYTSPHRFNLKKVNSGGVIRDQFDIDNALNLNKVRAFYLITAYNGNFLSKNFRLEVVKKIPSKPSRKVTQNLSVIKVTRKK